ncbi:thioredoxin domain-containing protein [Clostridioides mangenotii]|uniref:thioredoxin domain-containing protein n=1 Tax=Metaclostridioides mangenotii TaxID=1540 RepID=UPI001C11EB54|nr:thioredoxin domain-containing protein [Clostridioides mangenotii]MBU5308449.1 thioredoxin domain-containing protein [Clostridioides mangenotii]MCR1955013.1 thioredoxin domain-containing protein [Clostridioides mangenotii]
MKNNNESRQPNKLINEKSPYLLQHAYNPVYWYAWGEEAFKKAKEDDKPIFLSIGYSTCHWCHVMENESFEDDDVADILNRDFISIKVDREERPDVDSVYMAVCQAMTGSGGWPMSIVMTPDKKPFFAGTYIPKENMYGRIGMIELLGKISYMWEHEKHKLLESSEEIVDHIRGATNKKLNHNVISKNLIDDSFKLFEDLFDSKYGGFGEAPKFPSPQNLMFLMKYYKLENNKKALDMVEKTLQGMYRGGMFDHIGYGFSRYSTDEKWLAPHFEKMLYDNAMLVIVYLEAYQITNNELYKDIVVRTLEYIAREMKDSEGGFYSAQDADSEGEEGKFYTFTYPEILDVLGDEDGKYFTDFFDISIQGNFEGKNIPNLIKNEKFNYRNDKICTMIKKVFEYRLERMDLHKDDKILTSWSSLMVIAMIRAYKVLDDERYLKYSIECLDFIEKKLFRDGRLLARYRDGHSDYLAYLDDYAFLVWSYIELYEATYENKYLVRAIELNKDCIDLFWDNENKGFYLYGNDSEELFIRPKDLYDGAMPSGNSVASLNLIKLSRMTEDIGLEDISKSLLNLYTDSLRRSPTGYSFYLLSLMYELYESKEIIAVLKNKDDMKRFKEKLMKNYSPNITVVVKKIWESENLDGLEDYVLKNDNSTYYICEGKSCNPPFNGLELLEKYL